MSERGDALQRWQDDATDLAVRLAGAAAVLEDHHPLVAKELDQAIEHMRQVSLCLDRAIQVAQETQP